MDKWSRPRWRTKNVDWKKVEIAFVCKTWSVPKEMFHACTSEDTRKIEAAIPEREYVWCRWLHDKGRCSIASYLWRAAWFGCGYRAYTLEFAEQDEPKIKVGWTFF